MYKITIERVDPETRITTSLACVTEEEMDTSRCNVRKIYEQIVDNLDVPNIIRTINQHTPICTSTSTYQV